jgi:hypothetical protein
VLLDKEIEQGHEEEQLSGQPVQAELLKKLVRLPVDGQPALGG